MTAIAGVAVGGRYLLNEGDGFVAESPFYVLTGEGSLLAGVPSRGVNYPVMYSLSAAGITPGAWTYLAVTFDAPTTILALRVNGALIAERSVGVQTGSNNSLPLEIGRESASLAKYWLGKIDDVRFGA